MTYLKENLFGDVLEELDRDGLKRGFRQVTGRQSPVIRIDGKDVLNFCSNNYLDLAGDIRLGQAASACIAREGFGSGASRLVCGHMEAHTALERTIASFKGAAQCLVFSTGYMANVGIISSLFDRHDIIFSDRLNHASIIDGIQLSRAQWRRYPHLDMETLEEMLKGSDAYRQRCIVTDSVFSMDGDIAPLDRIVALAKKYDCLVMIDEAHAFGVMGEHGKGLAEAFGVEEDIDIQMGTLSKAAGSFGAYCCGSEELIEFLINKARSFIYTTGMPPSTAAASRKAVEIIRDEPDRRARLHGNAAYMRRELRSLGFEIPDSETPIIPIIIGESRRALKYSQRLFDRGVFVSAIRPPTVPKRTARLRLSVMATHTADQIDTALEQLKFAGRELCLI